jgi:O-antigen/teichoic acid export membrane protein
VTAGFRTILKDFAVYGTGEVLVRAFSFITLPIYTRIFSPEEYGALSYVLSLVGLVGAFLILGGDSAYARFYYECKDLEERRRLTVTWVGFLAGFSAVATFAVLVPASGLVAAWSFGSSDRTPLILAAFLAIPLSTINAMFAQVLRNEFRPKAFIVLNLASIVLTVLLGVVLVLLGMGVLGVFVGTFVASLIVLPIRAWTVRDLLRPRFSSRLLGRLLRYGLPLVPVSLAFWVFLTSDRLVLGKLSGLEQVGLYSVAVSLSGLLGLANNAFASAWAPRGIQMYEEDAQTASIRFGRMMTYLLAGMGFLCIAVTAFAPELLHVLSHEQFYPAAEAVGPLAFAMVAYASVQVTGAGISLKKQTKYLALGAWGAAIVNVILNLMLDQPFGMMGAAWATTIAYVFLTLSYLVIGQRLWPVTYELRRSGTLLVLTVVFMAATRLLPTQPFALAIVAKALFCGAFILATFLVGALDRREARMVRSLFLGRAASNA